MIFCGLNKDRMKSQKLALLFQLITIIPIVTNLPGNAQQSGSYRITRFDLKYEIKDSVSGICREMVFEGLSSGSGNYLFVPFASLTVIGEPKIEVAGKNGSWKKFRNIRYRDHEVDFEHFYSDQRFRQIYLPADSRFRLKLSLHTRDIFLFPSTLLAYSYPVDTLHISLKYPSEFICRYKIYNNNDSLDIKIDTLKQGNAEMISFVLRPGRIDPKYDLFSQPEREIGRYPALLSMILPPSYKGKEDQYLNDWYTKLLNSQAGLTGDSREKIKAMVGLQTQEDSVISRLSAEFRKRIKYLDIETGIGSLKPHNPNETLYKLQGDCKDMSYLLCCALQIYGINANMAIASSWYNNTDLDFPVISSGDHMICAYKKGGSWHYIDLTEKYSNNNLASRMLQNRHVYIVSDTGGIINLVKPVPADSNLAEWNIHLKTDPDGLSGEFELRLRGLCMIHIRELQAGSPKGSMELLDDYLTSYNDKLSFQSIQISDQDKYIEITGNVKTRSQVLVNNREIYCLWRNFIPYPHPFTRSITEPDHFNDHTLCQTLDLTIDLDRVPSAITDPDFNFSDSISSFTAICSINDRRQLQYTYDFLLNAIEFVGPSILTYNQCNKILKAYFDNVFVLR